MASPSRSIYTNSSAFTYTSTPSEAITSNTIHNFHKSLPSYTGATPLITLPQLAQSLHLKNLFVKDESIRFTSLPSFKPLGLSWAIHNGILAELAEEAQAPLPKDLSIPDIAARAEQASIKLISASDGDLGTSIARLGKLFGVSGIRTRIFVPSSADGNVSEKIKAEGVEVIAVEGGLEEAMREAVLHSVAVDGVFVDLEVEEGWEDIPDWIIEGYSTVFKELDEQLEGTVPDLVVVPVGIGGLVQAAVTHYRLPSLWKPGQGTRILAVEPELAAALHASLKKGERVSVDVKEGGTIMRNLNYGAVAEKAWEVLKEGLDASIVVGDKEVETAIEELETAGLKVGPCGGAVLAGLRGLLEDEGVLGLNADSIVVLIGTEGVR